MACLRPLAVILTLSLWAPFLPGQEQPKIQEEVLVRWWLVPVYAIKRDGSPVPDLSAEDFELFVNDKRIAHFDLHRKNLGVINTRPEALSGKSVAALEKKMVFFVFDSAFSAFHHLERAKKIVRAIVVHEPAGVQFMTLSIEPFAGIKQIFGPSEDRNLVVQKIEKYVTGKKAESLRARAMDSTEIRNVYPKDSRYADRNLDESRIQGKTTSFFERIDAREKKRTASVFVRSLLTLNLILNYFKDNTKIVYLFSCGIPASALEWKTETTVDPTLTTEAGITTYVNVAPDQLNLMALKDMAKYFNQSGSLLFLVNPAGTRLTEADPDSGEHSLRILAEESGGRYYDGPENEIAEDIASMGAAYYEISFHDSDEYQGQEMNFEVRPKNPDLQVYTVRRLSRGKEYRQMTGLEKEVLVLNLLDRGPYSQSKLRIIEARVQLTQEDGQLIFTVRPANGFEKSQWEIFKVWRKKENGGILMEKGRIFTEGLEFKVRMKKREGHRHELVLVHPPTGATIVLQ